MAFLVEFEGIDGAGKGTQAARLRARMEQDGRTTSLLSFPRYAETLFGKGVGDFLNGRFGALHEVSPFLVSLLYAGDRFESKHVLKSALENSETVILDRYVASNIAHQASKLDGVERAEIIRWIERIEYEIYGLPRPDLVILLDIPPRLSRELIARKAPRQYTDQVADIQEADADHLTRARAVYRDLAEQDDRWQIVSVADGDNLRTIDDIGDEIWQIVQTRFTRPAG